MRKVFKHISVYSLWLAIAAILAHMIIPHDHHILETFSDQEQNCPASNHQTGHSPGYPIHCHAFNDLASEEARFYNISQNIQDSFPALVSLPADLIFELQASGLRIIDLQNPFLSSYYPVNSLLRAPPFLA